MVTFQLQADFLNGLDGPETDSPQKHDKDSDFEVRSISLCVLVSLSWKHFLHAQAMLLCHTFARSGGSARQPGHG